MRKLSVKQKVLRSILAAIITLLPFSACVLMLMGDNSPLREFWRVIAIFILPSAFVLFVTKLLIKAWR